MELLLDLLCLCLLGLTGKTLCDENEPEVRMIVEGGRDVVLPCSLSTKENIASKVFDWKKVAQKDENRKEVFMYDTGFHYDYGRKEVSYFPEELKHGNASIMIRNTKVTDSGVYTCDFPNLQPREIYTIKLVVDHVLKDRSEENIPGTASKPSVTTLDQQVLQCEVHGNPKPKVELQDSDGNILNTTVKQDSEREGSFYITLQTTVTKTGTYRCIATQEEIRHQIYAETSVHISGFSTGWIAAAVIGVLFLVAGVILAVLLYRCKKEPKVIKVEEDNDVTLPSSLITKEDIRSKRFIWHTNYDDQEVFLYDKEPKLITVEEGSDVTLPCSLSTKENLRLTQFIWIKTDDDQVFLYDNGHLYSDERPGQSEQFKDRVSHFPDELEQGNASITIRNTTRADSGDYSCIIQSIQKHQIFYIKLVVGPKLITVEEGSDVTLPCSLSTKEDIQSTRFIWEKVSQTTDDDQVFLYDKGDLYSDKRPGQSEQFKGRVSHFPDKLEQGNVSIIIRNTTTADSGEYRCIVQSLQKPQEFYIGLVVEPKVIKVEHGDDVTLPCSLWPKDIQSTWFEWEKCDDDDQKVFLYDYGDLYSDERPGQSEKFKGRVSHFPKELEQGNASITIRNMTWADSGVYRCLYVDCQNTQQFYIGLVVVEPKVITVEEDGDVTLPCSLITKEDLRSTRFIWKKVSQRTDDVQMVFLYDNGDLYSDERPGQSEQFKGRVSHFPDKLEQGDASIIIRNTTRADSGEYECYVSFNMTRKIFYIKLDVVASTPEPDELHPLMMK
ncbi:muscle M-line assembly protein unc-89-like [Perca fluviatilis]|uniref:muscle M-line assembly protein unc-89-like n=1 Tax=Perca fluviatilis TaxID=8168 RepID=UPI001963C92D|nr:muscle M-line assembly protein unc-89-like [Perca fluviatilis]